MNEIHARALVAALQGIRANPKMRAVPPDTAARYAIEDADAVVRALGAEGTVSTEVAKERDEARAECATLQRQVDGIATRLAAVLWALPDHTVVVSASHTKSLDGRSWEIRQVPISEGTYAVTLSVKDPAPADDGAPIVPEVVTAAAETVANRPHRIPTTADLDAADHRGAPPVECEDEPS